MKIIILMGGRGTRLRPHTLNESKALLTLAGKPVLSHLIENLLQALPISPQGIGIILNASDKALVARLETLVAPYKIPLQFFFQEYPLGTAHALAATSTWLEGPVVLALGDMLLEPNSSLHLDNEQNIIWAFPVPNPSSYGVVVCDEQGYVTQLIEKPSIAVSNQAISGLYYFREASYIRSGLKHVLGSKPALHGEYLLPDAFSYLISQGISFRAKPISPLLDCGYKEGLLAAQQVLLIQHHFVDTTLVANHSIIIPPVYIGKEVRLEHSVVGPYVSLGKGSVVERAVIANSIVGEEAVINVCSMKNSLVGSYTKLVRDAVTVDLSDYSKVTI